LKSSYIPPVDESEAFGMKISPDLEYACFKFRQASNALDKTMRVLIKNYPHLVILANKLPVADGQNPYLGIRQAAYLYQYISNNNPAHYKSLVRKSRQRKQQVS